MSALLLGNPAEARGEASSVSLSLSEAQFT